MKEPIPFITISTCDQGMDLLGGGNAGGAPPWPWPDGVQGGWYFHDKAEKYKRHNEIHVIAMICHTVSEYHV